MYFAGARIQLLRAWVQININRTLTGVNLDLYSSLLLLIHQTVLIKPLGFLRKQLEVGAGGREIILPPWRAIKEDLISCHCLSQRMLLCFLMFSAFGFNSALFSVSRLWHTFYS